MTQIVERTQETFRNTSNGEQNTRAAIGSLSSGMPTGVSLFQTGLSQPVSSQPVSSQPNPLKSASSQNQSMARRLICGLCENRVLRHLHKQQLYWYCPNCRQNMPYTKGKAASVSLHYHCELIHSTNILTP